MKRTMKLLRSLGLIVQPLGESTEGKRADPKWQIEIKRDGRAVLTDLRDNVVLGIYPGWSEANDAVKHFR